MLIDWLCYRIVMVWPLPLPDCREHRAFAWLLARAGRYANAEVSGAGTASAGLPGYAPAEQEE